MPARARARGPLGLIGVAVKRDHRARTCPLADWAYATPRVDAHIYLDTSVWLNGVRPGRCDLLARTRKRRRAARQPQRCTPPPTAALCVLARTRSHPLSLSLRHVSERLMA